MSEFASSSEGPSRLPPRIEEQRLWEVVATVPGSSIGVVSLGRSQVAESLAESRPDAAVFSWYLDGYQADLARKHCRELANLQILCQADWPEQEIDLAAIALSKAGEAELSREVIQAAYHRLKTNGWLVVAVDNASDRWVHELLKGYAKSVKVRPFEDAMVYRIEKTTPLKKIKDYACELSFRDCDETIQLVTRPGVFSHREFDNGARQLLDAVDVFPDSRLLDIGCGSGAVTLGLAARDPSAAIFSFDSNARAVECTRRGATLNGFENVTVDHHWEGDYRDPNSFDMALANPPYFGDMRIAQWFVDAALRSLRPGGRLVLVTKQPKWYADKLPDLFNDVEVFESKRYFIASGVKPNAT